jgi:hypothetical protein
MQQGSAHSKPVRLNIRGCLLVGTAGFDQSSTLNLHYTFPAQPGSKPASACSTRVVQPLTVILLTADSRRSICHAYGFRVFYGCCTQRQLSGGAWLQVSHNWVLQPYCCGHHAQSTLTSCSPGVNHHLGQHRTHASTSCWSCNKPTLRSTPAGGRGCCTPHHQRNQLCMILAVQTSACCDTVKPATAARGCQSPTGNPWG